MTTREELYRMFGPKLIEAMVDTIMDEMNSVRSWLACLRVSVVGAGSLSALKSAIEALPPMPARTKEQLGQALLERLDATPDYHWMLNPPGRP